MMGMIMTAMTTTMMMSTRHDDFILKLWILKQNFLFGFIHFYSLFIFSCFFRLLRWLFRQGHRSLAEDQTHQRNPLDQSERHQALPFARGILSAPPRRGVRRNPLLTSGRLRSSETRIEHYLSCCSSFCLASCLKISIDFVHKLWWTFGFFVSSPEVSLFVYLRVLLKCLPSDRFPEKPSKICRFALMFYERLELRALVSFSRHGFAMEEVLPSMVYKVPALGKKVFLLQVSFHLLDACVLASHRVSCTLVSVPVLIFSS